jgi:hypothetical protein
LRQGRGCDDRYYRRCYEKHRYRFHGRVSLPSVNQTDGAGRGSVSFRYIENGEVDLKAGDLLIQRNTLHAWHNYGEAPCMLLAMVIRA